MTGVDARRVRRAFMRHRLSREAIVL